MHGAKDASKSIRVSVPLPWRGVQSLNLYRAEYDATCHLLGHDEVKADVALREINSPAGVAEQASHVKLCEIVSRFRVASSEPRNKKREGLLVPESQRYIT